MRRLLVIGVSAFLLVLCSSCQRRPFAERQSKVAINLDIKTNITNHAEVELPEDMRVDLYDPETARLVYTDYVGPYGGYIHPEAGVYDMIVYSIGSESTIIHNEHDYNEIEAYTNEVSAFIKSQLSHFLAKRAQAAKERAAKKAAELQKSGLQTKEPEQYVEEPVVNQPDHIFVGWYHNLEIPVVYEHDDVKEIFVEVDAHTIVETWVVEIRNLEGARWISSTAALVSGQRGSVHIGPNMASEKVVSLYFDMGKNEDEEGRTVIKGSFNTFGHHPTYNDGIWIDLSVKDTGGSEHMFHFDVSDQFVDNEKRYILIEEPVVIEEPKVEGGGFQPVVEDWNDVITDIIL